MISIVIPVLHEAESINTVIAHLRQLYSPVPVEIIVVDGDEGGDTLKAISFDEVNSVRDSLTITDGGFLSPSSRNDALRRQESEAFSNGVKKIISPPGRAGQMNAGAAAARGDILLFLHADTVLPPDGLAMIRSYMDDGGNVAGAFHLGINTQRKIFRITEGYAALRTRLTRIPFGDQGIFVRRDYFAAVGGYRDIPVMEDVELMGRIKRRGDRICIIPRKAMTSPRRWEREGVVCGTFRNWMLQILYAVGVPPERLARFYKNS